MTNSIYNSNPFPGITGTTTGVTVDAYVVALTLTALGYAHKSIIITNTHGSASLTFKVDGLANRNSTNTYAIMGDTALAFGDKYLVEITKPYDSITLSVKSTAGSTPSAYEIQHIMQRSGSA